MRTRPSYNVVSDLIKSDGTFITHCVSSGIKDYASVERQIEELKKNPPDLYKDFHSVVNRWEMSFA